MLYDKDGIVHAGPSHSRHYAYCSLPAVDVVELERAIMLKLTVPAIPETVSTRDLWGPPEAWTGTPAEFIRKAANSDREASQLLGYALIRCLDVWKGVVWRACHKGRWTEYIREETHNATILTPTVQQQYVSERGGKCPFCRARIADPFACETNTLPDARYGPAVLHASLRCPVCHVSWRVMYTVHKTILGIQAVDWEDWNKVKPVKDGVA